MSIERNADARSVPPDGPTLEASAARFYFQLESIWNMHGGRNLEAGACVRQVSDDASDHGRSLIEDDLPSQQSAAPAIGATLRHSGHQMTPRAVFASRRLAPTAIFANSAPSGRLQASISKVPQT